MNWQWFTVPYETRGLESVEPYTFQQYFQARVNQSDLGQTGPQAVPLISYVLGGKANGGPPLYQPEYRNIAPHVGIVWNPFFDKKSVFNAGGGIVYDRTVIFAIQALQDAYSYLFQQTNPTPLGNSTDPYGSIKNDPRLDKNNQISNGQVESSCQLANPLLTSSFTTCIWEQFVFLSPCGLQNGLAFNETLDPGLKTPYSITYNAGWQRSVPGDMVLKLSYVGRLGRRLLAQADANQVLDFTDPVSGELFSTAFASITTQLRQGVTASNLTVQPWFENVITPGLGKSLGKTSNTALVGGEESAA